MVHVRGWKSLSRDMAKSIGRASRKARAAVRSASKNTSRFLKEASGRGRSAFAKAAKAVQSATSRPQFVRDRIPQRTRAGEVALPLPHYRQANNYACGYVAAMMVLHYFDGRASPDRFFEECMPDEDSGTSIGQITRALRGRGLRVSIRDRLVFEEVADAIDSGSPVITTTRDGDHWVVVYGYSRGPRTVLVSNVRLVGARARQRIPWSEFAADGGGHDGGLVVSRRGA